jgi:hypothetical protein
LQVVEVWAKHFGDTAAENENVRFKQIHNVAEPDGEELQCLIQDVLCKRITHCGSPADCFAANRGGITVSQSKEFSSLPRISSERLPCAARDGSP